MAKKAAKKNAKRAVSLAGCACKPKYALPEGHTLFTSEAVTVGHPDKICDQVSDAVLDAMLAQDPHSRVACETLVTTGLCLVAGEVTTKAQVNIQDVVRQTIREIGEGPGKGHIRNFPLAARSGDKEFLAALDKGLKAAAALRPEMVFISSGFDAHKDDTLGGLRVTEEGFAEATRRVRRLADATASGRIISVLEGGYDAAALGSCVVAHLKALAAP